MQSTTSLPLPASQKMKTKLVNLVLNKFGKRTVKTMQATLYQLLAKPKNWNAVETGQKQKPVKSKTVQPREELIKSSI